MSENCRTRSAEGISYPGLDALGAAATAISAGGEGFETSEYQGDGEVGVEAGFLCAGTLSRAQLKIDLNTPHP
jgi:hypothetical protein